jgi:hypothetical protein
MARQTVASQTPTITASSAYASGNALGGKLTFANLLTGGATRIISAQIVDKIGQKIACDLVLFNQDFTATADKSALAISAADALNAVGVVSFVAGDYASVGTPAVATKSNINLVAHGSTNLDNNLYGQLVTRGTPTYTSTSDITVKLEVELHSP